MSHAEHTVSYSFNDVSRSPECGWHERSRPAWCMLPTALSAVSAQQLQSIGVCDCGLQAISNAVKMLLVACHSTGCMYVTFQVQDTHPGSLELLLMYADGADRVMQGTY